MIVNKWAVVLWQQLLAKQLNKQVYVRVGGRGDNVDLQYSLFWKVILHCAKYFALSKAGV